MFSGTSQITSSLPSLLFQPNFSRSVHAIIPVNVSTNTEIINPTYSVNPIHSVMTGATFQLPIDILSNVISMPL